MPSSSASSWFITLSVPNYAEIDQTVVDSLVASYKVHHVVKEYGKNGSHPHLHAYLSGEGEARQETVRRRWLKSLPKTLQSSLSCKVVPVNDYRRLIGSYLQKEESHEVLHSTFTPTELAELRASSPSTPSVPKSTKKHLTIQSAPDTIIEYWRRNYDSQSGPNITDLEGFVHVVQDMYRSGYRMSTVLTRIKVVYLEVRMILQSTNMSSDEFFLYLLK